MCQTFLNQSSLWLSSFLCLSHGLRESEVSGFWSKMQFPQTGFILVWQELDSLGAGENLRCSFWNRFEKLRCFFCPKYFLKSQQWRVFWFLPDFWTQPLDYLTKNQHSFTFQCFFLFSIKIAFEIENHFWPLF